MRSLLEWYMGVVSLPGRKDEKQGKPLTFSDISLCREDVKDQAKTLLKLFGGAPDSDNNEDLVTEIGPTRLAFWDCPLTEKWVKDMDAKNLLLTETKMENMIDRIRGVAEHPRNTERVPATALFDFNLTIRVHDGEDLTDMILRGLKLLELTGLGGSGSRGYGKIAIKGLQLENGEDWQTRFKSIDLNQPV